MLEVSLCIAIMLLAAYFVTARRSGIWKGRQLVWPTVRTALSGAAILVTIVLWKLWWGDSAAGSVFVLLAAGVLVLFVFFFVKTLVARGKTPR
jgi:hypothetical protein